MDPEANEPEQNLVLQRHGKKNLRVEQRNIVLTLLLEFKNEDAEGKLVRGAFQAVADRYHVTPLTIRRVWDRARKNFADPLVGTFSASPLRGNCGQKPKYHRNELRDHIVGLPSYSRKTLRSLATALRIPLASLHFMKEDKRDPLIIPHTNRLKPLLTEQHKTQRVLYALLQISTPIINGTPTHTFNSMHQVVHVDEKWFYLSEETVHMYLIPGEEPPDRYVQNRNPRL